MRLSTCLLLCLVAVVGCHEIISSPMEGFLEILRKAFPVLLDIFESVFREVNRSAFRSALKGAVGVVDLAFPAHLPPRVPERWWGEHHHQDTSIRKFYVHFSHEMMSDLRFRIHNRRNLTHALRGAGNYYGSHSGYLSHFLDYWADGYDFEGREGWLNSYPQYVTNVQGLDIHYIHVKPLNPHKKKVLPLLMLHGFPVTAFEFVHVIRHLLVERDDSDFVFEMIVPDLPGYGYSEATYKIGLAPYQMGIIFKNLMLRLGKPRFYIHAGDVGQAVGDAMAVLFPEKVLGLHTNFPVSIRPQTITKMVLGQLYPPAVVEARYEDRLYPLSARLLFYWENFGYLHVQATKPDNVGHGLVDSPVAHASWLIQNLIMATDPAGQQAVDGNLPANYHMDDFLDSLTVHWACHSMATAARSYAEMLSLRDPLTFRIMMTPTNVPFAAIKFRHELFYFPDDFLRDKYPNLVQSTTLDFGGHFVGYQHPAVLADSIWTAVAKMEAFNEWHSKKLLGKTKTDKLEFWKRPESYFK